MNTDFFIFMTASPPPADTADNQSIASFEAAMPTFSYDLKIPKDRIAVIIGPKGKMKRELEEQTKTKIKVDSKEGDVQLVGKDSLNLFSLREVIKAIGRGFNPEIAMLLFKQDYTLEIVDITDYNRQKSHIQRLRGRVIGADGKARVTLERLTETFIVVYGKTISVIGSNERCMLARRAVETLLEGSTHASVYKWLEKQGKQLRKKEGFAF